MTIVSNTGLIQHQVRFMRILRIYKLVRHFAGLQSLLHTLQQAYKVAKEEQEKEGAEAAS